MTSTPLTENRSLRPVESFAISLAFWGTLLCASGMYAVLSLAPGLVEHASLKHQHHQLVMRTANRNHEIHHLKRVASAMERDPDFVARLVRNELSLSPAGSTQFRVANDLGYDARVPNAVLPHQKIQAMWYDAWLIKITEPTGLRRKWIATTLVLYSVAFLFLNETFFSGRLGRGILSLIARFCQRYRLSAPKLD